MSVSSQWCFSIKWSASPRAREKLKRSRDVKQTTFHFPSHETVHRTAKTKRHVGGSAEVNVGVALQMINRWMNRCFYTECSSTSVIFKQHREQSESKRWIYLETGEDCSSNGSAKQMNLIIRVSLTLATKQFFDIRSFWIVKTHCLKLADRSASRKHERRGS